MRPGGFGYARLVTIELAMLSVRASGRSVLVFPDELYMRHMPLMQCAQRDITLQIAAVAALLR